MISFYSQEVDLGNTLKKISDIVLSEGFDFAKIGGFKVTDYILFTEGLGVDGETEAEEEIEREAE